MWSAALRRYKTLACWGTCSTAQPTVHFFTLWAHKCPTYQSPVNPYTIETCLVNYPTVHVTYNECRINKELLQFIRKKKKKIETGQGTSKSTSQKRISKWMWQLILCVNTTDLAGVQILGQAQYICERVSDWCEHLNCWLRKADGPPQCSWVPTSHLKTPTGQKADLQELRPTDCRFS